MVSFWDLVQYFNPYIPYRTNQTKTIQKRLFHFFPYGEDIENLCKQLGIIFCFVLSKKSY